MTSAQIKQYVRDTLIALRSISQEILVFDAVIDFITQSITTGIPAWTSAITFNSDGTGSGSFSTYPDTTGALRFWKSKTMGNINHVPPTNPEVHEDTYWIEVSPSSGSSIKEWAPGVFGTGLIIVYYDVSGTGSDPALYLLADPVRPFNSTNFTTELAATKWKRFGAAYTAENVANKETGSALTDDTTKYPSSHTVLTHLTTVVNALAEGLKWKQSVRVATTANITLSGAQTIDGVSVIAGNRVLVKNQTTQTNNGIYLCAAGAWTRTSDASISSELENAIVPVEEGTSNADTTWRQTADSITLGSSNIIFVGFGAAVPDASPSVKGIAKLYSDLSASNTDGPATQAAVKAVTDAKEASANKDASGGYAGLTLFKINFKNVANTFISFFTNVNTAARTYLFPDKDITVAGLDDIQKPDVASATASGTNTYTATLSPAITAYAANLRVFIKFTNANTATSTLNLNGLGAKTLKKNSSTDLGSGDILAGQVIQLIYDGTNFQVVTFYGLNITAAEIAAITAGETNLFTVTKSIDGTMITYGAGVRQVDNFAAGSLSSLLADTAAWIGDQITITGDNLTGGLGQTAQEYVITGSLGTIYKCVSHVTGTTSSNGSATWIRTRSRDNLDTTADATLITALTTETGWDAINNTKTVTTRSRVGSWHTGTTGYTYFCYDEVAGTSWAWRRIGQPDTIPVQITDATLKAEIEANSFTTNPKLTPVATVKGEDRQEHYWNDVFGIPQLAKCIDVSGTKTWIKPVFQQAETTVRAVVNLTATQIKASNSAAPTILAAPGANKFIQVERAYFKMTYGTVAFNFTANAFSLVIGAQGVTSGFDQTVVNGTANKIAKLDDGIYSVKHLTDLTNQALKFKADTSDATLGDSTAQIIVYYRIVDFS